MKRSDITFAVLRAMYGTQELDESSYECPYCHQLFEGRPTYCPHCAKRVIKKGTSFQFIDGIEEKTKEN